MSTGKVYREWELRFHVIQVEIKKNICRLGYSNKYLNPKILSPNDLAGPQCTTTLGLWPASVGNQAHPACRLHQQRGLLQATTKVRDGYAYPPAFYHQQDDSKASDALKIAKFVLVCQDGHKPPSVEAAEAYRGPYKIKSQGTNSYVLEGGSQSEDRVTINCLKPFHVREGEEEVDLQPPPRLRRPTRVAKPVSPRSPTPACSLPEDKFPPLTSDTPRTSPRQSRSCRVPLGHWRKFNL